MAQELCTRVKEMGELICQLHAFNLLDDAFESLKLIKQLQEHDMAKTRRYILIGFVDDARYDMPIIYHVEGQSLHFGRAEFSLVKALRFGTVSFRLWRTGHVNFVSRVLPNKVGVKVTNLDLVGVIKDEKLFGDLSNEDVVRIWILESCEQSILWWNKEPNVIPRALEFKVITDLTATISELKSDWYNNFRDFFMVYLPRNPPSIYNDLYEDYLNKLSASRKRAKIATKDLPIIPRLGAEQEESWRLQEQKMMVEVFVKRLKEEVMLRVEKEKLVNYEKEKHKRRHALMNSDHWKASTSRISNHKKSQCSSDFLAYYWGAAYAMAKKDRESNHLSNEDMTQFLKDVKPWAEELSRPNRATDRHIELWVNYMWHVRPVEADWAIVGAYFVQILLQDSFPVCYADGSMYKVPWKDVDQVMLILNVLKPFL
ncbi:hypothetical protein Tco_0723868 [Tanacetum coccineum]